jgi:hypothetical protein
LNLSKFLVVNNDFLDILKEFMESCSQESKMKIFNSLIEVSMVENQIQNQKIYKEYSEILFTLIFNPFDSLNFISCFLEVN